MNNNQKNEKNVSELEAERIEKWYGSDNSESWKCLALDGYEGPGTYEGLATYKDKDGLWGSLAFELVSTEYSFSSFCDQLKTVSVPEKEDFIPMIREEDSGLMQIFLKEAGKEGKYPDLRDLDQFMTDLHDVLGITEENEDQLTDGVTVVQIENGKAAGAIMDGVNLADFYGRKFQDYMNENLQKLYDYLSAQFADIIHDNNHERPDGLVITTYENPNENDHDDYIEAKGKNSRAVYDDEMNVIVVLTGTFVLDEEENEEWRREAPDENWRDMDEV